MHSDFDHPDADKYVLPMTVVGRPQSLGGAEELARRDKHEFEKWIVPKLEGHLFEGGRKGADGGIDGFIYFRPEAGFAQAPRRRSSRSRVATMSASA